MFKIKICGITSPADASAVAAAGVAGESALPQKARLDVVHRQFPLVAKLKATSNILANTALREIAVRFD